MSYEVRKAFASFINLCQLCRWQYGFSFKKKVNASTPAIEVAVVLQ